VSDDQAGALYRLVPAGRLRPLAAAEPAAASSPPRALSLKASSYRVHRAWVFPAHSEPGRRYRITISCYDTFTEISKEVRI
jgi:hypothetical protein